MDMKLVGLLPMPYPPLLHETFLKIFVLIGISDIMLHSVSDSVFPSTRPHQLSHESIGGAIQIFPTLILNDHVVQDHAGCDDVPKGL